MSDLNASAVREIVTPDGSFRVNSDSASTRQFWDSFVSGEWEPMTRAVFRDVLRSGQVWVDIGSWIGSTVLPSALKSSAVHSFEPDPVAYAALTKNVLLNPDLAGRVILNNAALLDKNGETKLVAPSGGGNSISSVLLTSGDESWTVRTIDPLDYFAQAGIDGNALLKIDIEGGEYLLLPRIAGFLKDKSPDLYLSFHPFNISGFIQRLIVNYRCLLALRHYKFVYSYLNGQWIRQHSLEFYLRNSLPTRQALDGSFLFTNREVT